MKWGKAKRFHIVMSLCSRVGLRNTLKNDTPINTRYDTLNAPIQILIHLFVFVTSFYPAYKQTFSERIFEWIRVLIDSLSHFNLLLLQWQTTQEAGMYSHPMVKH